jgi:hypothetical protein
MTVALVTAAAGLVTLVSVAVVSFRVGRARGFGEIFHVRMEAAHARRRMHDLTRDAFVAISEAADAARGTTEHRDR